ncbi:hypothetical protein [Lactiplantibacillus plantarum]|uniref:hypothetical protein n=1 Tax=Lactiplantibacillus plantarum TaxID=1590 RepID=UPI0020A58642|nr:hypothetical protein [Lactiplantibacillus plantarum]UTD41904.1 hypothetical protein H5V40_06490 [Lactiplantibacillus plantarum]
MNTGQLTIGQGYITSVSSGTRSINGVPKQFNSLQGTLSASYLKFTNDFGSRNYIDADMLTCSSPTNNGTMVAINATGNIGINAGDPGAPALTISSGHIDASSSSSYGVFGAITLGYNAHTSTLIAVFSLKVAMVVAILVSISGLKASNHYHQGYRLSVK